jgi:hypothetical protein
VENWALAHGVRLAPPRDATPRGLHVDLHVADEVEALLERAHDALAARDGAAADASLAAAESALRVHPELPHGAWLMAEVERTRSTRYRRVPPADAEAADRNWMRAEALDGGRTAGIGEDAAQRHAPAATITLRTVPDGAEAWLDGNLVGNAVATATTAGPHLLHVTADGAVLSARWLELAAGMNTVEVVAIGTAACSSADVSRASLLDLGGAGQAVDASRVRCEEWIAVAPGEAADRGVIRVARCGPGRCGPLLEWRTSEAWSWLPPPERQPPGAWPAWATWTLAGAGAVVAAGVVVVATGVLAPGSTETRFVTGPIKTQ